MLTRREKILAAIAFATVCFIWSTSFVAIRVAVEGVPPLLLTGGRFTLAGAALLAVCVLSRQILPTNAGEWLHQTIVGVLMIGVGNLAIVWAAERLNSGTTAMLIATGPFWMGAVEALRPRGRRFSRTQTAGLLIAFLGIIVLAAPALGDAQFGRQFLLGALSVQLSCIAWALGSVRSKYRPSETGPLAAAAVQMLAGGGAVLAVGLAAGEAGRVAFTPRTLTAFLYLTAFGSVAAYTAYLYALSKLSTATVALSDYIIPGLAVLVGQIALDEPLGPRPLAALALILFGVSFDHLAARRSFAGWLQRGAAARDDCEAEEEIAVG